MKMSGRKLIHHINADVSDHSIDNLLVIRTNYWRKPVPCDKYDWEAWMDGNEDSGLVGHGISEVEAVEDLVANYEERMVAR